MYIDKYINEERHRQAKPNLSITKAHFKQSKTNSQKVNFTTGTT